MTAPSWSRPILAAVAASAGAAFALSTPTVQVTGVDAKDSVTRQAMVGFSVTGTGAPVTGSVIVTVTGPNATAQCSGSLNAGTGACEAIFNPHGGTSTATAYYPGDSNYAAATSAPFTFFNPVMTQVAVTSSPAPSLPGQLVTLTAHVNTHGPADAGSFGAVGGSMDFFVDTGYPCTGVTVADGVATCNVVLSTNGTHFVSAMYSGDASYGPSEGESSPVVSAAPATMTFTSPSNPSPAGTAAVFRLFLSGASGTPTGTAAFKSGGLAIHGCESIALYNGAAACSTGTLSVGDHAITVQYSGDAHYPAATGSLTQTVSSTTVTPDVAKPRDFNGDGRSDLVLLNNDGSVSVWLMDGVDIIGNASVMGSAGAAGSSVFTGDFDGDGKVDLLRVEPAYDSTQDSYVVQFMNGLDIVNVQRTMFTGPRGWSVAGIGDFNGDHKSDVLWKKPGGGVELALMNGTGTRTYFDLMPDGRGWSVAKVADFNADGRADILWKNTDGSVSLWLMDGGNIVQRTPLMPAGSGWDPVLTGDFNGDGNADIVWFHAASGATSLWLMNGTTILQRGPLLPAGSTWRAVSVGDFNGDGKSDLMFRNSTDGSIGRWFMDGLTPLQKNTLLPSGTPWAPAVAINVNNDLYTDMVWRATDGSLGLWLMGDPASSTAPPRRTLMGPTATRPLP